MRMVLIGLCLLGLQLSAQAQPSASKDSPGQKDSQNNTPPSKPIAPSEVNGKSLKEWREVLKSSDPSRRSTAILAIMQFGEAASVAVPDLIQVMDKDPDVSPRTKAVTALRVIDVDGADVNRVVLALARRINSGEGGESQVIVRYEALVTLQRFMADGAPAIPALKKACNDRGSWEVRRLAVANLWQISAMQGAKSEGADSEVIRTLMNVVMSKSPYEVKIEALNGLAYLGKPADPALQEQLVKNLLQLVGGPSIGRDSPLTKTQQLWALAALSNMGESFPGMTGTPQGRLASFLKAKELDVRRQAATALGTLGKRAIKQLPALISMLDDEEPLAVASACQAIMAIGEKNDAVVSKLISLLESKRKENIAAAANTLVAMREKSKRVLDTIDKIIADEKTDAVVAFYLKNAKTELLKPDPKK
ncbi:MAG: HEAT repeat domain-containing protein [Gemmataceae bacterium]